MKFDAPVLLVGNGPLEGGAVALALEFAQIVVAADGGAAAALRYDLPLAAVIGDMDSVDLGSTTGSYGKFTRIDDQDTTDFEKCLSLIDAPLTLGIGFLSGRLDHELAALNALVRHRQPVVLIGEVDLVFVLPAAFETALPVGTRMSFFPLGPVAGVESEGLEWELDGLSLSPTALISTSNRTAAPQVELRNPGQPLLCILPRETLGAALKGFKS